MHRRARLARFCCTRLQRVKRAPMTFSHVVRLASVLVLAPVALASAQNSANANVTADVQAPLVVTKTADLVFGAVFPGSNKAIAVTDGGAAKFTVAGQASANVNITFTLPATIASGGNTLPIAS